MLWWCGCTRFGRAHITLSAQQGLLLGTIIHSFAFIHTAAEELIMWASSQERRNLKLWLILALGLLWYRCDEARWQAVRTTQEGGVDITEGVLFLFLSDLWPEVRAVAFGAP